MAVTKLTYQDIWNILDDHSLGHKFMDALDNKEIINWVYLIMKKARPNVSGSSIERDYKPDESIKYALRQYHDNRWTVNDVICHIESRLRDEDFMKETKMERLFRKGKFC